MSDSLLASDISSWLSDHAGRAKAKPRSELLRYLQALGHAVNDRQMRRAYADMNKLGSSSAGIFLIVDAEDRKAATRQLHSHSMSELVREKRIREAAPQGQMELYEEGA